MISVRRARACLVLVATLALALPAFACGDDARAKPPAAAVETAGAASLEVRISGAYSTTPTGDDEEQAPVSLDAHVFGAGPTGVILAHMRPADQTSWFPFAARLAAAGNFTVLTFDFRGFGASAGEREFDRMDTDLMSAYRYMRDTLHVDRVFLVGASIGGTASLVVGSRVRVAGVIAISAPAEFENLDAVDAVGRIAAPKLFIVSKDDVSAQRSLDQLVAAAADPKDQQIYDGDAHGTDLFEGPHADDLTRRLIEFLSLR